MKVRSIDDTRWKPALELLLAGKGTIALGDVIRITWWTEGVLSDPNIRVDILSDTDPRFLSKQKARNLIADGLRLIQAVRDVHPELDQLMTREPVSTDLVYDYGKGSVKIAEVAANGIITWEETLVATEYGSPREGE